MSLFSAIASMATTHANIWGARRARLAEQNYNTWKYEQDVQNQQKQNEFNSGEALKARDFDERMFGLERDFNAGEAAKSRDFAAAQTGIERDFNARQAAENRDFQERMSNTQYQRATRDMIAAGINPMLAVSQGGAGNVSGSAASSSAPSGASASASGPSGARASSAGLVSAPSMQFQNLIGPAVNSGLGVFTALNQSELLSEQTNTQRAQTLATLASVKKQEAETNLTTAQKSQIDQILKRLTFEWESGLAEQNIESESARKASEAHGAAYDAIRKDADAGHAQTKEEMAKTERRYLEMEEPGRKGEEEFQRMLNDMILGGSKSAAGIADWVKMILGAALKMQGGSRFQRR